MWASIFPTLPPTNQLPIQAWNRMQPGRMLTAGLVRKVPPSGAVILGMDGGIRSGP